MKLTFNLWKTRIGFLYGVKQMWFTLLFTLDGLFGAAQPLTNATITYSVENGLNGFIAVVDPMNSTILNNYILDPPSNTVTIDFSGYQSGTYTLTMIVNGQIVDALNVIVSN